MGWGFDNMISCTYTIVKAVVNATGFSFPPSSSCVPLLGSQNMNSYPNHPRGRHYEDNGPPPAFHHGPRPDYVQELEQRNHAANMEVQRLAADNELLSTHLAMAKMKEDVAVVTANRLPYITVEYEGHEVVVSRQTLMESSLVELYIRFTKEFGMTATESEPFIKKFHKATKTYYSYAPMRLSVILWKKGTEDPKKDEYREVVNWEESWRDVAYFVEKIRIVRRPFTADDANTEEPVNTSQGIFSGVREYIPKLW